ncbi:uncharacterized protein F5147DRAFT_723679 [Suillus discolor]|uniref:PHD-type domain-containing protein n=1 Tax=Suillus discolor TaxID=1912936 RepID=A0A9P7JN51_9AGAM|nr:uncharacterized protein F5147DRAFT_723679 [Suillus discolor]KAG2091523.1 hypothetical protein F5147DRAFT_723679 [Suillus discolor]
MAVSDKSTKTSNEVAPTVTGNSIPQLSVLRTPDMSETMWLSHLTYHQTPGSTNEYTERGRASSDDASPTRPVNGLLPPFSTQHVHLPTPLSPSNLGAYGQSNITPRGQILLEDVVPTDFRSISYPAALSPTFRPHKMITPDSSPLVVRSRANGPHGKNDERSHSPPRIIRRTPPTNSPNGSVGGTAEHSPRPHIYVAQDNTYSATTQQSMEVKNATPNRKRPASQASSTDFLLPSNSISLPPSASQELSEEVGGEMARIRAQLLENQISLTREAEARRPDYLKRAKRIESPPPLDVDGIEGQRAAATIGVTESPIKGRRLMLFQQTSDESFEESLMAGGYDRYRTDLQRPADPGDLDPSGEPEAFPLVSEQELRQQNRLSAFRSSSHVSSSRSKLAPVEVEGYGRVLMDIGPSDPPSPNKLSPSKKKRYRKKKKTPSMDESRDQKTFHLQLEANADVPNWPDAQFPWRLRSEQCDDFSKMEEEQRLRYIENFLSRDSDDEDDEESLFENQTVRPGFGSGRGKTYPLLARSQNRDRGPTTVSVVPSDPADARTALLSKRSIRQFSFRRAQRKPTDDDIDDEIVCICRGSDDGRELVQCDECHTWYHLQCIGIRSVADLGREEDPWFCGSCAKTPPPDILPSFEPTFVPTEEKLRHDKSYDPPFFHVGLNPSPAVPWNSSPRPPMTPPGRRAGPYFSSGSSWDEASSQPGPRTPQLSSQSVRVYTMTPGCAEPFVADESPFDPTSTPSRGIRFGAPFATPKNNFWQGRGPELFHTPTRPSEGMSNRRFGHHLLGGADDSQLPITHLSSGPDITPIGRNFAPVGRLAESPLAAKNSRRGPGGGRFLDEHFDSARGGRHG